MNTSPLVVVGIGQDGPAGLGPEARAHLASAEMLAGGKRHLSFFPEFAGPRIVLDGELPTFIKKLQARDRRLKTVLLATGDPLFYGIGRVLLEAFPRDELLFVQHVSSVALAFARLKETWNDACVVSLHGRPLRTLLPALQRGEPKIAIFTDEINNPAAIARLVMEQGVGNDYVLHVCENLGAEDERITHWAAAELTKSTFAPLNIVVLLAECSAPTTNMLPLLGLPESAFQHRGDADGGLITKRGVRLQALCALELNAGDVFWDIGAGSGSVAIEAARLSPNLRVFAVERAPEFLHENLRRFGLSNIQLIDGVAPKAFAELPDPDAVFIGGSGGQLLAILEHATNRLKPGGRLVVSCIAVETLTVAWQWLSERGLHPDAISLQIAQTRPLGSLHCLEPEHPITLVRIKKP